jgi:hypothetical protein
MFACTTVSGIRSHGLGPLAAYLFRSVDRPVPAELVEEERLMTYALLTVEPVLARVRAGTSAPLVLFKGPEVGLRYPGRSRWFGDVDLLVPDAAAVHRELQQGGFVEVGDPALYVDIHHLRPLQWPSLPLIVEVHSEPKWPERLDPPRVAEIMEAAVPSTLGIEGISAPDPAHHALILAAHGWAHEPLRRLRDLVDVAVIAAESEPTEIERVARAWGLAGLWRTTDAAAHALLGERTRSTVPLRTWARHLPALRERKVVENHLQAWVADYWALPPRTAVRAHAAAVRHDLSPEDGEGWSRKIARAAAAIRRARAPLSAHERALDGAAPERRDAGLSDAPPEGARGSDANGAERLG